MEKTKNAFQCIVVTVLFWVIAKIVPGVVEAAFQGSVIVYMAARFAFIFAAWKMTLSIYGGKHWQCAWWNFYVLIFIEALSVLNLLVQLFSAGQFGYSLTWYHALLLLLTASYIALCVYLAKQIKPKEGSEISAETEESAEEKRLKSKERAHNAFAAAKVTLCYWFVTLMGPALIVIWNNLSFVMTGAGYGSGSFMYKVLTFAAQPVSCAMAASLADSVGKQSHRKCVLINCAISTFALLFLAYYQGTTGNKEIAINMVISACSSIAMMFYFLR